MKKYGLLFVLVSLWRGFLLQAQVSPCSEVQPLAAFVNPFDATQLHLASFNASVTEFFGYPQWSVVDAEGVVLAEETLNYFGLVDTTWHALNVLEPFDFDVPSLDVELELHWNSVNGPEMCSFPFELKPWIPTPDENAECMNAVIQPFGTAQPGSGFILTLTESSSGEELTSIEILANEDGLFGFGVEEEWCLDLDGCFSLAWEPINVGSQSSMVFLNVGTGDWGNSAWFNFLTVELALDVAGVMELDPYGPSCSTSAVVLEMPEDWNPSTLDWVAPNPMLLSGRVPEPWRGASVYGVHGTFLGTVSQSGAWPPGTSGCVLLKRAENQGFESIRVCVLPY